MIALLANEATENIGFWADFTSVVSDPAHILAEAVWELGTGVLIYPLARWLYKRWLKRHDREVHGVDGGH